MHNQTLLEPLLIDVLCYMPCYSIRIIPRLYRCYLSIHPIIRGCEIVFVSVYRPIYLMCVS